jgi:hypothetical protein
MLEEDIQQIEMCDHHSVLCTAEHPTAFLRRGKCMESMPKRWLSGGVSMCSGMIGDSFWSTNPMFADAQAAASKIKTPFFMADGRLDLFSGGGPY